MPNTLEMSMAINCSASQVYEALHHLEKWETYLPHIEKIEILYDDGMYQEFIMHVVSKDEKLLQVRSARRCNNIDEIRYFQPKPPEFLKAHSGSWKISSLTESSCELKAAHSWEINEEVAQKCFPDHTGSIKSTISSLLEEHALFAMKTWKDVLESGAYK